MGPHRPQDHGRLVRLAGYRSQHLATIDLHTAVHRITLLVVPPEAGPDAARGALLATGRPAGADDVETLLLARDSGVADGPAPH